MEITDAVLAELDVDEYWHVNKYSDEDMGTLIRLIRAADDEGFFADLNCTVDLTVQTLDDIFPELILVLTPLIELAVPGLSINGLVPDDCNGPEQARAILTFVHEVAARTLADHKGAFMPLGEAKHTISEKFPHAIEVREMADHWFVELGHDTDPVELKANLFVGHLLVHDCDEAWEGRII